MVISESQLGETTDYTYGLERISAISGNTRTEYVYDGRGSVAAEVSYNTAWYTFSGGLAKKNVTSKSYTPFGEQIGEATSGFGYNGEYYNAATGMIYRRARFYEPQMNRFSQKDTLRGSITDGASLNRYLYCQSDPVNFADYNGRQMAPGVRLRASQDMSGSRPCHGSTTQVYYRKEAIPCPGQGPRNIVQNVGTLHSNSVKKRALRAGSDLSAVTRRGRLRAGARSVTSSRDALIRRSRPAKTRATCPTSQLCCVSGSFHGFAAAGRTR